MNIRKEIIETIVNSNNLQEFEEHFESYTLENDISKYLLLNYIPKEEYISVELNKYGEGQVFKFLWSTAVFQLLSKTNLENYSYLLTKILSEDSSWNKTNAFKAICYRYSITKNQTLRNLIVNSLFSENQFSFVGNLIILFDSGLTVDELDELISIRFKENKTKSTISSLVANFVLIREFNKKYKITNKDYIEFIKDIVLEKPMEMDLYKRANLLEFKLLKGNALKFYLLELNRDPELLQILKQWKSSENHKTINELLKTIK